MTDTEPGRVCADCWGPVAPCPHTPSKLSRMWDHATGVQHGGPCDRLFQAFDTVPDTAEGRRAHLRTRLASAFPHLAAGLELIVAQAARPADLTPAVDAATALVPPHPARQATHA